MSSLKAFIDKFGENYKNIKFRKLDTGDCCVRCILCNCDASYAFWYDMRIKTFMPIFLCEKHFTFPSSLLNDRQANEVYKQYSQ